MMEERRKYSRVSARLPLKLFSLDERDIITETANISCGGAYCRIDRFIPVMTKLRILMFVPNPNEGKRSYKINCEGIVVRTEPEYPSEDIKEYHIAIYFSNLRKKDRAKIAEYVRKRAEKEPSWN